MYDRTEHKTEEEDRGDKNSISVVVPMDKVHEMGGDSSCERDVLNPFAVRPEG
jgi:hypothetical protein